MSLLFKFFRRFLLLRICFRVLYYKHISSCNRISGEPMLLQPLFAVGPGKVCFGSNVKIGCNPSPYLYNTYAHFDLRDENSEINISDNVWINNNVVLIADCAKISIGKNTIIGPNLSVFTSDFHDINPNRMSANYIKSDVVIGENVFIGMNVTILKGVSVGDNTVIGTGSIVSKSFPANVVIAGNPAKIIKNINNL